MCLNISKVHTRIFSKRKKSGKMLIMRLVANLPIGKHSNNNNNNNNNNNLAIVSLILLNKIALVLCLLNLMFVFKGVP